MLWPIGPQTAQWHVNVAPDVPKFARPRRERPPALSMSRNGFSCAKITRPNGVVRAGFLLTSWIGRRQWSSSGTGFAATSWSRRQDLLTGSVMIGFLSFDASMRDSLMRRSIQASSSGPWSVVKRELVACLRTGRMPLRVPRARPPGKRQELLSPGGHDFQGPAEVDRSPISGHWEGDLIWGLKSSAMERSWSAPPRFTLAAATAPACRAREKQPRIQERPPLTGHGAEARSRCESLATIGHGFLLQLRRSLDLGPGS